MATTATTTTTTTSDNQGFIRCWNEILTPKFLRFRHLQAGNGKVHGDLARDLFGMREGQRVLDVGCGFGESCLEIGRVVGPEGDVLGVDCTRAFLDVANAERDAAGLRQVRYEVGDAQVHPFGASSFDLVYSRFGVMFFQSQVAALRNFHRALAPGGTVCLVVWRALRENPCWSTAREVALEVLPEPAAPGATCGPGPFSMASAETTRAMLAKAQFAVERLERIDAEICVGRDLDEAVDYQLVLGPAGEIIREAGDEGARRLPEIRARLRARLRGYLREEGVLMPSSTWAVVARKGA